MNAPVLTIALEMSGDLTALVRHDLVATLRSLGCGCAARCAATAEVGDDVWQDIAQDASRGRSFDNASGRAARDAAQALDLGDVHRAALALALARLRDAESEEADALAAWVDQVTAEMAVRS